MGIQYFVSLLKELSAHHFLSNDGSLVVKIHIIQGRGEQPDLDFLTFMQ